MSGLPAECQRLRVNLTATRIRTRTDCSRSQTPPPRSHWRRRLQPGLTSLSTFKPAAQRCLSFTGPSAGKKAFDADRGFVRWMRRLAGFVSTDLDWRKVDREVHASLDEDAVYAATVTLLNQIKLLKKPIVCPVDFSDSWPQTVVPDGITAEGPISSKEKAACWLRQHHQPGLQIRESGQLTWRLARVLELELRRCPTRIRLDVEGHVSTGAFVVLTAKGHA